MKSEDIIFFVRFIGVFLCQYEVGQQATQLVVSKYLGEANEQAKKDPKYAQSKE